MKIIVCYLRCDVSHDHSIGVGRTDTEALDDAITHFADMPRAMILDRIKRRMANPRFYKREIK